MTTLQQQQQPRIQGPESTKHSKGVRTLFVHFNFLFSLEWYLEWYLYLEWYRFQTHCKYLMWTFFFIFKITRQDGNEQIDTGNFSGKRSWESNQRDHVMITGNSNAF